MPIDHKAHKSKNNHKEHKDHKGREAMSHAPVPAEDKDLAHTGLRLGLLIKLSAFRPRGGFPSLNAESSADIQQSTEQYVCFTPQGFGSAAQGCPTQSGSPG